MPHKVHRPLAAVQNLFTAAVSRGRDSFVTAAVTHSCNCCWLAAMVLLRHACAICTDTVDARVRVHMCVLGCARACLRGRGYPWLARQAPQELFGLCR